MTTETKTIKLSELLRPLFDPFTKGEFKGCHYDLHITHSRRGNRIWETFQWAKDSAGLFLNKRQQIINISLQIKMAEKQGIKVIDDIPEGNTIVQ